MPFFLERPGDEYGNIGHWHREGGATCAYGPGEEKPAMHPVLECVVEEDDEYGQYLRVVAPASFPWPTVAIRYFIEVSGPQRFLTDEQAQAMWAEHGLWPVKDFTEVELLGLKLAAVSEKYDMPLSPEMQAHVDQIIESHMRRTREEPA